MNTRSLLIILFLLVSTSFAILPQDSDWKIPYSKYRLIYSVDINSTVYASPLIEITIQIPHSYIDDMLQYYEAHNYTWNRSMWARIYYFNTTSGEHMQIPCRSIGDVADEGSPYCLYTNFYRGVPDTLKIYTENSTIEVGTNYYVTYLPLFFWEDFETYKLGGTISSDAYDSKKAWLQRPPTYNTYTYSIDSMLDSLNMSITTKQIIFEANYKNLCAGIQTTSFEILFYLVDKDQNEYVYHHNLYSPYMGGWRFTRVDVLKEASSHFGIPPSDFVRLKKVVASIYNMCSSTYNYYYLDNVKIIPPDVNDQ